MGSGGTVEVKSGEDQFSGESGDTAKPNFTEEQFAEKLLWLAAPKIAKQNESFSEKWALGTAATLGLIVSQVAVLKDITSLGNVIIFALIVLASLVCYMVVRYSANAVEVLADVQPKQEGMIHVMGQAGLFAEFDMGRLNKAFVDISIAPVSWFIKFKLSKEEKPTLARSIINSAQKAARWMIFQILLSFVGLVFFFATLDINKPQNQINSTTPARCDGPQLLQFIKKSD